jgi:hypothetical protein
VFPLGFLFAGSGCLGIHLSSCGLLVLLLSLIMDYLRNKLDFGIGKAFEHDIYRKTGSLVHSYSQYTRGFYLLATLRRYLFQLNEESVALALQSCLGGHANSFRVSYQSHNHFQFTVACKAVGFSIYNLRRFIGDSFDVYFHLWSNGAPHWEREKRLWEEEEAKQWTKVLSKSQKEWLLGLLLLPSVSGKEFALLKKLCKTLQSPNRSLLVFLSLSKLATWTLSFCVLIPN